METEYFFAEDAHDSALIAPPQDDAARFDWLRLIRSRRVGPTTFRRLMAEHGTAKAALAALLDVAAAAGVANYAPCPEGVIRAEMKAARKLGAQMLCMGEAHYPAALAAQPSAPPLIWCKGRTDVLTRPLLAMVGARNASSLGMRMAQKLADELGEAGFVVVSGLARGIDTAAHSGALAHGTVAVMAGGLDVVYPAENTKLAADIPARGLCMSELAPGTQPQARHFPARNRIVAGMAQAVLVIEAAAKSGSLITARLALDAGREVMAVPGHPYDGRATGCNMLIRDGAPMLRNIDDVIEALGAPPPRPAPAFIHAQTTVAAKPPADTCGPEVSDHTALPDRILALLSTTPIDEDTLIRDLAQPAPEVLGAMLELEMQGAIARAPGGRVMKTA
ncbi:MAG: DNA-processing protein DprA [Paracoccaceae bacterium]